MIKKFTLMATAVLLTITSAFSQATEPDEEILPGWWKIPKTSVQLKVGGYVKLDLIHDFNPIGSPDYFDVSKIPTDGPVGENTHLNVKETRLFIDTKSRIKSTSIRAYVEGDFYGSGGAFRLRHAFLEIGRHLLVGQFGLTSWMSQLFLPLLILRSLELMLLRGIQW